MKRVWSVFDRFNTDELLAIWMLYGVAGCLLLALLLGPIGLMVTGLFVMGVLVWAVLCLWWRIAFFPDRWRRLLPLLLVTGCLAGIWPGVWACVDLHVVARIWLAGGPHALRDWGRQCMAEQPGPETEHQSVRVEAAAIPARVRQYLAGYTTASGHGVNIELGGGFFHYGVTIRREGTARPPTWWGNLCGWPPEVEIYQRE